MEYDPNLTVTYLAGLVDKLVKDQGRDTIKRNVSKDPNARYARIPNGNACDFCKMLGSRGFVYHSEEKASISKNTGDEYHKKCNCQIAVSFDPFIERYWVGNVHVSRGYADDAQVVVPGRDGSDVLRKVDIDELFEQYKAAGNRYNKRSVYKDYSTMPDFMQDPLEYLRSAETEEELRERADEVLKAYKDNFTSKQLEKYLPSARSVAQNKLSELQIKKSISATRARENESLRINTPHISERIRAVYEKPRELLADHEKNGVDHLLDNGFPVKVLLEDPKAPANIDFEIRGSLWEMKNVTNKKSSVSNQFKRARAKWKKLQLDDPVRVVFTTENAADNFDDIVRAIRERKHVDEMIIVFSENGDMVLM